MIYGPTGLGGNFLFKFPFGEWKSGRFTEGGRFKLAGFITKPLTLWQRQQLWQLQWRNIERD